MYRVAVCRVSCIVRVSHNVLCSGVVQVRKGSRITPFHKPGPSVSGRKPGRLHRHGKAGRKLVAQFSIFCFLSSCSNGQQQKAADARSHSGVAHKSANVYSAGFASKRPERGMKSCRGKCSAVKINVTKV